MSYRYTKKLDKIKKYFIGVTSALLISGCSVAVQAGSIELQNKLENEIKTIPDLAPNTLAGLKVTYNILGYQDNGLAPDYGNYPSKGTFIHIYNETLVIANNFDAFYYDFSTDYQVVSATNNQISYSFFDSHTVTTLNFSGPTSGTFVASVLGGIGSYSGEFKTEKAVIQGFSPKDLVNGSFSLSITEMSGTVSGDDLPPVESMLKIHFAKHTNIFLRSDLYDEWDIIGDYFYQRKNDNTAKANVYLRQSGRNINFNFTFSSVTEGKWTADISNGEGLLKGSFYYGTNPPPENYGYGEGSITEKRLITSEHTTSTYPYQVYLPRDYFTSDKKYPVIYTTDGQWLFWDFSKAIDKRNLDAIFVAVDAAPGDLREVDYTLPGSTQYLEFLKQELIPEIEKSYRTAEGERTLVGFSYGGTLIRHAFIDSMYTKTFKDFVSIDGAMATGNEAFQILEYEALATNPSFDGRFILTGGDITWDGNGYAVDAYYQSINSLNLPGLSVYHQSFHLRHTHISVPSFEFALDKLFK